MNWSDPTQVDTVVTAALGLLLAAASVPLGIAAAVCFRIDSRSHSPVAFCVGMLAAVLTTLGLIGGVACLVNELPKALTLLISGGIPA